MHDRLIASEVGLEPEAVPRYMDTHAPHRLLESYRDTRLKTALLKLRGNSL